MADYRWVGQILGWLTMDLFFAGKNWEFQTIGIAINSVYDYHLSRSDAASDQAAKDVEDDERNAAGSAEN